MSASGALGYNSWLVHVSSLKIYEDIKSFSNHEILSQIKTDLCWFNLLSEYDLINTRKIVFSILYVINVIESREIPLWQYTLKKKLGPS